MLRARLIALPEDGKHSPWRRICYKENALNINPCQSSKKVISQLTPRPTSPLGPIGPDAPMLP